MKNKAPLSSPSPLNFIFRMSAKRSDDSLNAKK
jgi:hypothetical protein